jgi:hypothetical protein
VRSTRSAPPEGTTPPPSTRSRASRSRSRTSSSRRASPPLRARASSRAG